MLSFNIRDLLDQAAKVDGELAADDPVWQEGDPKPIEPIRVTGRLSPAGANRFYFSGRLEGTGILDCRRCLIDVRVPVAEDLSLIFAEPGEVDDDDPDVYPVDPRKYVLDLRPAIREQWLVGMPAFAVCRDDCQGLCARCGAELNNGPCGCPPESDSDRRWEALRALRGDAK